MTNAISFNKTLSTNVPSQVDAGKQEIHFTERGEIFTYKQDGSKIQLSGEVTNNYYADVDNATIVTTISSKENSLILHYDFDKHDESLTYMEDISGQDNHSITFVKAPTFETDGNTNRKVAVFSGANYICLGKIPKVSYTTVSVMAYKDDWTTSGKSETLISCTETGGYNIILGSDDYAYSQIYISSAYKKPIDTVPMNSYSSGWHVFTITSDGYTSKFYIDKRLVGEVTNNSTNTKTPITYNSSNSILLGAEAYTGTKPASSADYLNNCKIAEVRIYNKGLTDEEVSDVYDEMMTHKKVLPESVVTINGDYNHNTYVTINEMSNPLTLNPLEYGYFGLSTNVSNYVAESSIPFDTVVSGNMGISNGVVKLSAGKTYRITCPLHVHLSTNSEVKSKIVNSETGDNLIVSGLVPTINSTSSQLDGYITPDRDIKISVRLSGNADNIHAESSTLIIQEIRNNPVAQYGGFETQVLFDGVMSGNGDYTLAYNSEDYNYIIFEILAEHDKNLVPTMTSNTSPSPYVITSSGQYSAEYAPWKAFDKKEDFWSPNASTGWITIDFGRRTIVDEMSIMARKTTVNGSPKSFKLYGSNDNQVFDEITSISNELNWVSEETRRYKFPQKEYRYYKLDVTENNGRVRLDIRELGFYDSSDTSYYVEDTIVINSKSKGIKNGNCNIEVDGQNVKVFGNTRVSKIIGVKGQIPSLLVGGEF